MRLISITFTSSTLKPTNLKPEQTPYLPRIPITSTHITNITRRALQIGLQ